MADNYDVVKNSIIEIQGKISNCKNQLLNIEREYRIVEKEGDKLSFRFEKRLKIENSAQHEKYVDRVSAPYSEKVVELEEQLLSLKNEYQRELEEYSDEHLDDLYYDKSEMLEEIQKVLTSANNRISSLMGKRFQVELDSQMDGFSYNLSEKELVEVCEYFDSLSEYFDEVESKGRKFEILIKFANQISNLQEVTGVIGKQATLLIFGIACLAGYLYFKFIFPIYLILLVIMAVYNVHYNDKLYQISITRKAVQDNLEKIEKFYREQAEKELSDKRDQLTSNFERDESFLQNELKAAKDKLESMLLNAESSFIFDDSALKEEKENLLAMNAAKKSDLTRQKLETEQQLKRLLADFENAKKKLDEVSDKIVSNYLNYEKIGESFVLAPQFLLDVDAKSKKPKFFDFNYSSNLILHDSVGDAINFIQLLLVQLRARLNPSCYSVTIFDSLSLCKDFLAFKGDDKIFGNKVVNLSNPTELSGSLDRMYQILINRNKVIKKEFPTIEQYNDFMISEDCPTESFYFVFLLDPDPKFFSDLKFRQLLQNGGDLGIYFFVFNSSEGFCKGKETSKEILAFFRSVYVFTTDARHEYTGSNVNLSLRAKEFVLENMLSK